MDIKKCKMCEKEKHISEFRKDRTKCKECEKRIRDKFDCICEICGNHFKSQKSTTTTCSKECQGFKRRKRVKTYCDQCGKEVEIALYRFNNHKNHFCSLQCANLYQKENPITGDDSSRYNSKKIKCGFCGYEFELPKNRINRSKNNYCSIECRDNHYKIIYKGNNNPMFGKVRENLKGEKHWNYNKELTQEERLNNRNLQENDNFKRDVRERDNYTCCKCNKRGGDNVVHHLNGYDWDKENRFNINNGVTLCCSCHKEFHTLYGYGKNTLQQYQEWNND